LVAKRPSTKKVCVFYQTTSWTQHFWVSRNSCLIRGEQKSGCSIQNYITWLDLPQISRKMHWNKQHSHIILLQKASFKKVMVFYATTIQRYRVQ